MSSISSTQNEKTGYHDNGSVAPSVSNVATTDDVSTEFEEEDEEDEDIDFNPFLRGDSPSEASSSLSSENESPDDIVERNFRSSPNGKDAAASSRLPEETVGCEDEETVMQATVHDKDDFSGSTLEKETGSSLQQGDELTYGRGSKDLPAWSGSSGVNFTSRDGTFRKPILQIDDETDDEDAICRRTRAHHSLANYSLEELETFLQESDDDGDLPNSNDEEEYRKFLAAVLLEDIDDEKEGRGDENIDEDEDNDADFELEIEEALESDVDEGLDYNKIKGGELDVDAHMPVTRHKKRLKESSKNTKTPLGQAKMPLHPLMSYASTMHASSFPTHGCQFSSPVGIPQSSSSAAGADLAIAFTAQQIGQLYCLIHEHVQLLVQVFSVSILDPSKQEVASGVQKMIFEINHRREEALGQRKIPYPEFCFHLPNLQSSLLFDFQHAANGSYWAPSIDNPVLSVLDVAPLRLVKSFMTDISDTVLRYRRSHVEAASNKMQWTKEPLFPLPALESARNPGKDASGGINTMYSHALSALQVSPGQAHSKKSLASVLVENTKKDSVALVPRNIARSAQRFYPLFNAALFPHKPPPPSLTNRVLFTDAEDGLLAMGIMQYNNDWASIQQYLLPSKSTHQIFVRQKNRSSSKAPENPIKAVRRMKSCPLTTDEKARICEGLRVFNNDWFSVGKFIVPHKDPSMLPRLWRMATGTQKSYKNKRRQLNDAKKRKLKASMDECQTLSDKEVDNGGDYSAADVDGDDEAYVHEAFLADSEHGSSKNMSRDAPLPSTTRINMQSVNIMPCDGGSLPGESCSSTANGSGKIREGTGHRFQNSCARNLHPPSHCSQVIHSKQHSYNLTYRASNGRLVSLPLQTNKSFRVVKLAPDLPPVNLPPSVRVISQSAFMSYHSELPASPFSNTAVKDHVPRVSQQTRRSILNAGEHSQKKSDNGLYTSQHQDASTCASQFGAEENTTESDLQMHPLLFQAPENQPPLYFSNNIHDRGSKIHDSLPSHPPQVDSALCKSQYLTRSCLSDNARDQPERAPLDLHTIDFHPLLQRADNENVNFASRPSLYRVSENIEASQNSATKLFDQFDCIFRVPMLCDNQVVTGTSSLTHSDKENNLDLDISLCSAPHGVKTADRETKSVLEYRALGNDHHGNVTFSQCSSRFSKISTPDTISLQAVPQDTSGGYRSVVDLRDDSVPGIVMEQEELSDSEEEVEHVEFECEEIDDSEDEKMSSELPSEIQNKEFSFFSSKEEEIQANHALQSKRLMSDSVRKSEKPKRSGAKTNSSCISSRDLVQAPHGGSSKKRSSDMAKMHPMQSVQCKAVSSSRKLRNRARLKHCKSDASSPV